MCVRFWVTRPEEVDDDEEEEEEEVDDNNDDDEEEEGLKDIPPIDDLSIPGGAWLDVCFCLYETDI